MTGRLLRAEWPTNNPPPPMRIQIHTVDAHDQRVLSTEKTGQIDGQTVRCGAMIGSLLNRQRPLGDR